MDGDQDREVTGTCRAEMGCGREPQEKRALDLTTGSFDLAIYHQVGSLVITNVSLQLYVAKGRGVSCYFALLIV